MPVLNTEPLFAGNEPTPAVLVGTCLKGENGAYRDSEISLDELERLLETAGGCVYARMIQNVEVRNSKTVIGSGKVKELSDLCQSGDVRLVIFDDELTPIQIRNLEDEIEGDVRVIDRTMLILDIFALHATSAEGKIQVELAQLKYSIPRLTGQGKNLSRQGGGIGTRGPGETKLETDSRMARQREQLLREKLEKIAKNRQTMRKSRERNGLPRISIVGYTNAGKSSLLNALTDAGILAEDKLFATLDPTTRKYELPSGEAVLLTDTVGFIRKLPHHLIEAFRTTLEEATDADLLILLLDISDPEAEWKLEVSTQLLTELGARSEDMILVYNKIDALPEGTVLPRLSGTETVSVSAKTGEGIPDLLEAVSSWLRKHKRKVRLHIPAKDLGVLNQLYRVGQVENVEYTENGAEADVILDAAGQGKFRDYIPEMTEQPEDESEE